MKIVAINGSPRKNGNTAQCLEAVGREVEALHGLLPLPEHRKPPLRPG